ncbi:MAG: SGNH/GDSL hydrolase family protein [Oscillospiraceae bacterium]|nr:SGNH/GDSL hydrolase family protein [Oscillospiraceae bacterium]
MNLTIFGDSVMKGVSYINGKYQISAASFAKSAPLPVDVRCRFGCTSEKGLDILKKQADRIEPQQTILLEFGGNDSDFDWDDVARRPDEPHGSKVSVRGFEEHLRAMISLLRARGAKPVLMTLPPIDPFRYFDYISVNRDADALLHWLKHKERIYTFQEQYSLAVNRIGEACGVPVADVRAAFLRLDDFLPYISDDGIHPNDDGHALITQTLSDFFERTA